MAVKKVDEKKKAKSKAKDIKTKDIKSKDTKAKKIEKVSKVAKIDKIAKTKKVDKIKSNSKSKEKNTEKNIKSVKSKVNVKVINKDTKKQVDSKNKKIKGSASNSLSKTKESIKASNYSTKRRDKFDDENFDETDEDTEEYDKPVEFNSKIKKETDLVKELSKEDDLLIEEDDDDKDPEGPKDEDLIALEELDEIEDTKFTQDDLYEGIDISDNVRMYLKEIGQYQLLNIEREKKLARDKQQAQNILKKKGFDKKLNISKEDAIKLPIDPARLVYLNDEELKIVKNGELAQKVLIESNLRLVVSIAKRYIGHGLSLLDLIQEGNLGLTRGIEKFDYKMGFKLSTYVTWWIRQAVSRALADQSKTIRIPVHMVETINRLNKEKKKLTTELGHEPSTKQLAKALKMSEEKVEEVIQIAMDPISLDKPVGDEDDSIVADFIADQSAVSPESNAERVMLKEKIQGFLSKLKDRERRVLELRFGINDDHPRTLEEVGKELKVTRERIRQIEDKALKKLRYKAVILQDIIK